MRHGELWWATLPSPAGSGPGSRRPVVVVQTDEFNESRIATVVVAAVTSNLRLAAAPGNVLCRRRQSGLRRDSVINVSQLLTVDKSFLTERVRELPGEVVTNLRTGLRLVLGL
jgi:mRNA interferase MazF